MGFIQNWFNDLTKGMIFRHQAMMAILNAIEARDVAAIKEVWNKIDDKNKFINSVTEDKQKGFVDAFLLQDDGDGGTHIFSWLIMAAVETGDLDVFKAVYEQNPDPNYVVSRWSYGDFANVRVHCDPLLALAIKSEKRDIALYLVAQPGIEKNVVGHKWSRGIAMSDNSYEIDPVPLELAGTRPAMKDVFYEMVKMGYPRSSARAKAAQYLRPL